MKYSRFEDLPVWKAAIELAIKVFALTAEPCFQRHSGLRSQIENAAVSVSNNIAEGFERGTKQELLTFIYIARGSAGEVRSMMHLLERMQGFDNFKSQISNLKSRAEEITRQLHGWANSLQNSDIRGPRYLNDNSRNKSKEAREREEFLEELRIIREGGAVKKAASGEK